MRFVSLVSLAVLLGLAACVPREESPSSLPLVASAITDRLDTGSLSRTKPRNGRRHILLLSSGGADGAFGAGVLNGWSRSGRRPRFDIVTGISTGALQATPAFVGSDYDGLLREVYTSTRTSDLLEGNGLGTLFKTGVYELSPLRKRLEAIITEELLDRVAAEHQAGRRLLVGTTDLTNGRIAVWDLGAIASSRATDRRDRYITILLACVAAPGLIEPISFGAGAESTVHGDGGVTMPILFDENWLPGPRAGGAVVWILANGHVDPEATTKLQSETALALGRRGVSQLLRQLLYTQVKVIFQDGLRMGASVRLMAIPRDVPEATNPFAFEPQEMRRLYDAGLALGAAPDAWQTSPVELGRTDG